MASGILSEKEHNSYIKNRKKKQIPGIEEIDNKKYVFKAKEEPKKEELKEAIKKTESKIDSTKMSPLQRPSSPVENPNAYNIAPIKSQGYKKELAKPKGTKGSSSLTQGYLKAGALSDGYQVGDVTKTILGTITNAENRLVRGAGNIIEGTTDASLWALGKGAELLGQKKVADNISKIIQKDFNAEGKVAENTYGLTSITHQLNNIINGRVPYVTDIKKILEPSTKSVKSVTEKAKKGEDLTVEEAIQDFITNYQTEEDKATQKNTILGEKSQGLVESAGQLLATQELQMAGIPWWVTTGVSTFGNEAESALGEGASYNQAGFSGLVSALAEVLTENLSGISFGGKPLDVGLKLKLSKGITDEFLNALVQGFGDVVGEGAEEVLSEAISRLGKKLSYQNDKTWKELFWSKDALRDFVDDFVGGGIMGAGFAGYNVNRSVRTGRNYTTGLTKEEQKVVDKEVENRIGDEKVSAKQRTEIEDQVKEDLEKGYISADTISQALNENYSQIEEYINKQNRLNSLLDKSVSETTNREREEIEKLRKELEKIDINKLKQQVNQETLNNLNPNSLLNETYRETLRRSENFTADLSKYNDKMQNIVKKAIDSGILNNTNKTHDFVDMIAKISADKGVDFDFTNNNNLKNSGFAIDGATINGYVDGNTVTLNIDSKTALNSVVGHEITHILENTELYDKLQESVENYAKTKGVNIDSRLEELKKLYSNVKGVNVRNELTSDLVGEYLFTDKDFVNRLSTEQPNLFKKILDEIKYLVKVATAGSKEKKELLKAQKMFEEAYRTKTSPETLNKEAIEKQTTEPSVNTQEIVNKTENTVKTLQKTTKEIEKATDKQDEIIKKLDEKLDKVVEKIDKLEKTIEPLEEFTDGLKEVTDEDLFDVNMKEVENQFDKDNYNLNEDEFTEYEIDGTNFRLDNGNILEITTPYTYDKKTLDKIYQNQIDFTITDNNGNTIDEYSIKGKDNNFTKEEILNAIKHMTYNESNKVANGQIDMFNNIHKNEGKKYSLTQDNQGRELSKQQQEYFKDSKVRDDEGQLIPVYHGTTEEINVFDKNRLGKNTGAASAGEGFFFTDNKKIAEDYSRYARPQYIKDLENEYKRLEKIAQKTGNWDEYYKAYEKYEDAELTYAYNEDNQRTNAENQKEVYLNLINPLIHDFEGMEYRDESYYDLLKQAKENGNDGAIFKNTYDGYGEKGSWDNPMTNIYVAFESNQIKNVDNTNPTDNPDIRYSLSVKDANTTKDNQGRKLSEGVIKHNENSVMVDENGDFITVYHTTGGINVPFSKAQFNVFNPVGTPKYRYGNQVVNFFTDSKEMSGSYVDQNYEMADTSRVNSIENVEGIVDYYNGSGMIDYSIQENDGKYELYDNEADEVLHTFDSQKDLFKNIKQTIIEYSQLDENPDIEGYQYEGYLNLTNPYIIDANGAEWNQIKIDNRNELKQEIKDKWDNPKNLSKELTGGTLKELNRDLTKIGFQVMPDEYGDLGIFTKSGQFAIDVNTVEDVIDEISDDLNTEDEVGISTNDVVFSVLAENAMGANYDGVIIKNVVDYGGANLEEQTPNNVYVTFNPNQFKAVDNLNPTDDADIRYQLGYLQQRGNYNITGEDIRLQEPIETPIEEVEESIIKEPIKPIAPINNYAEKINDLVYETNPEKIVKDNNDIVSKPIQKMTDDTIAKILTETPVKKKRTALQEVKHTQAMFASNILDKGIVFENLAYKTKNRAIKTKWDYMLTSAARGQNIIGNGHYEFDKNTKTMKQTSKSLYDIQSEVFDSGKTEDFYNYMYHLHNADRMSLQDRFGIDNKPVFGDNVYSKKSLEIANKLEKENPEFKKWANDVYEYENAERKLMVDGGLISQETADLWEQMYPHYIPTARTVDKGNAINVPLDTGRTGVNAPIKKAKGGNQDILPLFDTMSTRTNQLQKALSRNDFGVELKNTLNSVIESNKLSIEDIENATDNQEELLKTGDDNNNPTFTVFENGEKVTYEITEDMYNALKPTSELLSKKIKPLNKFMSFQRGILTEYNPLFMATNAIKDIQDVFINSQHTLKTYNNLPESYAQILSKGYWYKEYMANGGEENTYFDVKKKKFKKEESKFAKGIKLPLKAISEVNNLIELAPRLAEYMASRKSGKSVQDAMYDAATVTTNFKAGGDVTKFINRNGGTFLNASIQGAMQQVRNIRDANANGIKGWANLATKTALVGIVPYVLNKMLWDDDDDYEELSDYVKQNYYIIAKYGDGKFIRIPKGRTLAVIQDAIKQVDNARTGSDEVDMASFLQLVTNNLAPNNPIENNILSPLVQAKTNKTWYGGDLLPKRLENLPTKQQYDESTSEISKKIGEVFNISPYKVDYVLNQYSGGVGDVVLPMTTKQAESEGNSPVDYMLAPIKDKFTTDSVINNKNVSNLYSKSEELTKNANKTNATDEDKLQNKYINYVKSQMNDLYKQKREIQNSNLDNDTKYKQVREIQKQIDEVAKNGLNDYKKVTINGDSATVNGKIYKLTDDGWTALNAKQTEKVNLIQKAFKIKDTDYTNYANEISSIKKTYASKYGYKSEYRKQKVVNYIEGLDLTIPQKVMLLKEAGGYGIGNYKNYMYNYISNLDLTKAQKEEIYYQLYPKRSE